MCYCLSMSSKDTVASASLPFTSPSQGVGKEEFRVRSEEVARVARSVLCSESGLRLALLFGSATEDALRRDSDVDIAVLYDHPLGSDERADQASRLALALFRPVDLVDLFVLNGTILKQVLCKGRILVGSRANDLAPLVRRMIYNQADMMPYVRRTLLERQERFLHG